MSLLGRGTSSGYLFYTHAYLKGVYQDYEEDMDGDSDKKSPFMSSISIQIRWCKQGFRGRAIFFAQNLRYLPQVFIFATFCASFAHGAEQVLRNILYHTQQVLRNIAQNNLRKKQNSPNLCKTQYFMQELQPCIINKILTKKNMIFFEFT